ncbi:MAG: hypothetical protein JWQ02_1295 [Capsulimonas sp.]|nr:hypothetical protein [Capsulimonas sp.]
MEQLPTDPVNELTIFRFKPMISSCEWVRVEAARVRKIDRVSARKPIQVHPAIIPNRVAVDEAPRPRIVVAVRQAQKARLPVRVVAVLATEARRLLQRRRVHAVTVLEVGGPLPVRFVGGEVIGARGGGVGRLPGDDVALRVEVVRRVERNRSRRIVAATPDVRFPFLLIRSRNINNNTG